MLRGINTGDIITCKNMTDAIGYCYELAKLGYDSSTQQRMDGAYIVIVGERSAHEE